MVASVMMSPDSMPLKLMPKDKNMPMVHAYLHPHMGVAITADEMPSMPAGAHACSFGLCRKTASR